MPNRTRVLGWTFIPALLAGCSVMPNGVEINPPKLHVASSNDKPATKEGQVVNAADAELIPVRRYYERMQVARQASGTQLAPALAGYVDAGVTLVNSYCLRWFQRLSDQDTARNFTDGNVNVIRELGTALLGLGKANTYWITSYGAANTAYAGLSKNFNDAFLLAPNSRKVKAQVLGLLDQRAEELRTNAPVTFDQAYMRLERFADLCTQSAAKEIVNNALDQATATLSPDGKIELTPTSSSLKTASQQLAVEKDRLAAERAAVSASTKPLQDQLRNAQAALQDQTRVSNGLGQEAKSLRDALSDLQNRLQNTEEQLRALQSAPK